MSCERLSLCNGIRPRSLDGSKRPLFRGILTTYNIAGLDLNYRKCCWVQYGTDERESLCSWISENSREFCDMQIVRHAKYIGTMIGPDGYFHRWTAPRKKSFSA